MDPSQLHTLTVMVTVSTLMTTLVLFLITILMVDKLRRRRWLKRNLLLKILPEPLLLCCLLWKL